LAIHLKKLDIAFEIASESENEQKWRQLADLSLSDWKVNSHFDFYFYFNFILSLLI